MRRVYLISTSPPHPRKKPIYIHVLCAIFWNTSSRLCMHHMQTPMLISEGAVWNKLIQSQVHIQQMSGHVTGFQKLTIHAKQTYSDKCIWLDNAYFPSNSLKKCRYKFLHKRVLSNERSRPLLQTLSDRTFCCQPDYKLVFIPPNCEYANMPGLPQSARTRPFNVTCNLQPMNTRWIMDYLLCKIPSSANLIFCHIKI